MSEVERVARAIYGASTPTGSRWECVEPHYQEGVWRKSARAAIAAMQPQPVAGLDWWKPDPEDPFWMLEAADGEWLKNEHSMLGTRDAVMALRFPTERAAYDHRASKTAGFKWWNAKPTEHLWCNFAALSPAEPSEAMAFPLGASVEKRSGSQWRGKVVGYYATDLTPHGVCVESEREVGSVQIYPAKALRAMIAARSEP